MTDAAEPEPIVRLYDRLQDCLRARDKEGAIEAYCQLFLAGRPLGEIISKGALDHAGGSDSEPHNPIQTAAVEQAASALGGPVVSEDTPASNPDLIELGSDVTAAVRSVGVASGSGYYEQWWFVWRKHWVVGALTGIGALVALITLEYDTSLGKVAAAIKTATDTGAFADTATNTAPAKPGSTFAGLNAKSNITPPSKPADAPGRVAGASGGAAPNPPAAADASPDVVVAAIPTREDLPDEPGPTPPPKPADASGQASGASGEDVPNPPVGTDASPNVVVVATPKRQDGPDQPATTPPSQPADAPGQVTSASGKAATTPPVGADASPNVVVAAKTEHGKPGPSEIETKALVSRGDVLLGMGDLTAARLFYRRGADLSDGTAALRLGETFDPAFLQQAGLGRAAGDLKRALYWYHRAQDLGNRDAYLLTKGLSPPGSNEQ
ncbi:MAG: hypothetical protein WA459_02680 [Stellaceae bacterium]